MPNSQGASFHKSNLNEYLAQCFLSALGVSAPVIRQEDIGIDFYCALSQETDSRLTFHSPFTVQCGSEGEKNFVYGGFTDKGRWRQEAQDWLFAQQVPFFACTVNAKEARFRLYQTSAKWMVRNACGHLKMAAVELLPDVKCDPVGDSIPRVCIAKDSDCCDECDGFSYGVPLNRPVVELKIKDLTNKATLDQARDAMKMAVEVERGNITYNHHLEIFLSYWFTEITPNAAALCRTAYGVTYNPQANAHVGPLLETLKNTAVVLALNLNAQGKHTEIDYLAPVFRLFRSDSVPNNLLQHLPKKAVDNLVAQKS